MKMSGRGKRDVTLFFAWDGDKMDSDASPVFSPLIITPAPRKNRRFSGPKRFFAGQRRRKLSDPAGVKTAEFSLWVFTVVCNKVPNSFGLAWGEKEKCDVEFP